MNPCTTDGEPVFTIPPDLQIGPTADALPLAGEVNYGIELFDVAALRKAAGTKTVVVGVCDTGIDDTHPLLKDKILGAWDFTGSPRGHRDVNEHGTHCSGTVGAADPRIGVNASNSKLVHGKCLSDSGSGAGSWIAAAMRKCVDAGAKILSLSLGSPSEDPTITGTARELAQQGVWIFAAGGNSGNTPNTDWPGRSQHCLSVAAVDSNRRRASFSNTGDKIDTSGPGVNIWSTRPGGGFRQMSGTSMATPFCAGVASLLWCAFENAGVKVPTMYELRDILAKRSTDAGPVGDDREYGPGLMDATLLALLVRPDPPPVSG